MDSARGNRFGKNQGYRPRVVPPSPCRCRSGAGGCGSCARDGASWGGPGRSRNCPHRGRRSMRSSACPPSFKSVRGAKPNTRNSVDAGEQDWSGCARRSGERAWRRRCEDVPVCTLSRPDEIAPLDDRDVRGASQRAPHRIRDAIPPRPAGDGINFPAGTPE